MRRTLLLGLLLATVPALSALGSIPPMDVRRGEAILSRMEHKADGLNTFTARLRGRVSLPLLPALPLTGRVYFQRPDHVKVEIDHVPRVVDRYRNNFVGLVPAQRRRSDYVARLLREDALDGKRCDVVCLTPRRGRGNVRQILLWVERMSLTVPQAVARYRDGTTVTTHTHYVRVHGYMLPGATDVSFQMPLLQVQAHATCSDYHLNQKLPPTVFTPRKRGRR